jgi:DNA-binding protein HU-beta
MTTPALLNKDNLVTQIANKTGQKKIDIEQTYDAFLDVVRESLAQGQDVRLSGVGTLKVKQVAERTGRNPRTGEALTVPASRRVQISTSTELKAALAS